MGFFGNIGKFFKKSFKSLTSGHYLSDLGSALTPSNWFSDYDGDAGVFGHFAGDIQDFWKSYTGEVIAEKNLKAQQAQWDKQNELNERQFAYQQQLNKEQQWREDNAYLRKVQDLKNAGLNPVLAAGGSGSSSAALSAPALKTAPAPQLENTSGALREISNQVFSLLSMRKDFAVKDAEISMMRANKAKAEAEAAGIRKDNEYKDSMYQAKLENIRLENKLKSGTLKYDIQAAANKVSLQDKELLIKDMELMLGDDKHKLNAIDYEIKELVKSGKITENQILDKKLELLTTECLQKALDLSNAEWDTEYYHDSLHLPKGFNPGWLGGLGMLIGGLGTAGVEHLIDFFGRLFGGSDSSDSGKPGSPKPAKPFKYSFYEWKKAIAEATKHPSSASTVYKSLMYAQSDFGVRRNH